MSDKAGDARLLLSGIPEGLVAVVASAGGESPRDRHGRLKARLVDLVAATSEPCHEPELSDGDLQWVLARDVRQWESAVKRFGPDQALTIAYGLVRHGAVILRCRVTEGLGLGPPTRWTLTETWAARAASRRQKRLQQNATWQNRALRAAEAITALDPGLAASLTRARGHEPRLPVLIYAADDLAQGRAHQGPRAFSQAHFRNTKERDDVAEILRAAGASDDTITSLGIARSGYVGIGGPVKLPGCDISKLRGPVQLRADDPALREPVATAAQPVLLIVENLQAAESICDRYAHLIVLHTAGQPADGTLQLTARLASATSKVIMIPDADLGGARIATRVLTALPDHTKVTLIDIGAQPHTKRDPFGAVSVRGLEMLTHGTEPVATFGAKCLARGYPVEQEASTLAAISEVLKL